MFDSLPSSISETVLIVQEVGGADVRCSPFGHEKQLVGSLIDKHLSQLLWHTTQ